MKMIIIVPVLCILSVGYIDAQTNKIELTAQNYSSFSTITEEELEYERQKFNNEMKKYDKLIFNK